ncbi:MAG: hypothetical protein AAGJ52_03435 [Pseudomonadota bacterium]
MNPKTSPRTVGFWTTLCLVFLPMAIAIQWAWSVYFKRVPESFWIDGASQQVLMAKSVSEIVIYSLMLWFLLARTTTRYRRIKQGICALIGFTILYTAYFLISA